MKQFQLVLKNEKLKQYFTIAFLFVIINILIFLYFGITSAETSDKIGFFVRAGFVLASLGIDRLLINSKRTEKRPYLYVAMGLITLSWLKEDYWLAFGICLLISLLFLTTYSSLIVKIGPDLVTYPSFPKKNIHWSRLKNVILRDGLLTIDFKNNKLIQQEVDENKTQVDEKEFNEFCQQHLTAKAPGRQGTQG